MNTNNLHEQVDHNIANDEEYSRPEIRPEIRPEFHTEIRNAIDTVVAQRRIPAATYRLQFNADFTFADARAILGYLDDLGISDLYASPIFLPRAGSTHGYDVADPTKLNPALGSEADFDALSQALHKRAMGLVLDIVPNHMGINDARNEWWVDVLENGPSSEYASFFDIQWHPIKQEMENQVLLPILGDQYGIVLERGELQLHYDAGSFSLRYYEHSFPISPRSYIPILRLALDTLQQSLADQEQSNANDLLPPLYSGTNGLSGDSLVPDPAQLELESIITALGYLPARTESDPLRLAERVREKEIIKRRLDALHGESAAFRDALQTAITHMNGEVGKPHSFDLLDALIHEQAYRLAFWRVAGEEINYRRFFDINELAAIRVEEEKVFAATHSLALRLLAEGKAQGLRIDHPDGLYAPETYFYRLQQYYLRAKVRALLQTKLVTGEIGENEIGDEEIERGIDAWLQEQSRITQATRQHGQWPLYVVAEKILSEAEPLPQEWAVFGTTGYAFLAATNGLFVNTRNDKAFTRLYSRFSGNRTSLREMTFATKMMIMRDSLAGEITTLAYELERIGERNRHYRDFTLGGIRTALREVVAALGIYRTYIDAHQELGDDPSEPNMLAHDPSQPNGGLAHVRSKPQYITTERDRKFMQAAVHEAKRRHPLLDDTLFDYIEDTLLLRNMQSFDEADRPRIANWVMKFQQLTGPVMAKGVEDTAFYRYNRLVSLNEVGDHPSQFGLSVEHYHKENGRRVRYWPHAMLATSTHDNKRSEDVRARINVLSEMPDTWQNSLRTWSRLNATKKLELDGEAAPDANDEYLFYQTLLGTWPIAPQPLGDHQTPSPWGVLLQPVEGEEYNTFRQRISQYMIKAVKEAKVYTSWLNPHQGYEDALARFVDRVLQPSTRNRFLINLAPLARQAAYYGHFNSLAQTLLKLTAPGLPDLYQGNELWDFSLVDPDNRRAVDYDQRMQLLKEVKAVGKRQATGQLRYAQELVQQWHDGRIKLLVTQRTLRFRRDQYDIFTGGEYIPLDVVGARSEFVCAFMRRNPQSAQGEHAIIVVPRLVATLTERNERPPIGPEIWGDTRVLLPSDVQATSYRNLFTSEALHPGTQGKGLALPLAEILGHFPVALLA